MSRSKISRRTAAGLAAVAIAVLGLGPARAASDPQVVIDEIYGQVEAMCGGDGQGAAYDIYAISKAYFAPALDKAFEAAMESGDLGFDVLVDGQDCRIGDLKLDIVARGQGSATARATFENMGEPRVIDLIVQDTSGDWRVTDIVYGHRKFSLRDALKR